jgi:hypothetical protein
MHDTQPLRDQGISRAATISFRCFSFASGVNGRLDAGVPLDSASETRLQRSGRVNGSAISCSPGPKRPRQGTIEEHNPRFEDRGISNDIHKSKEERSNMGYGGRDKAEPKSGRAGFVEARLEELRRRWEAATDEREKAEVSDQIREWQAFRPERSSSGGGGRR